MPLRVGSIKITDMWPIHYSELLNSVHDTSSKSFVSEHIDAVSSESIVSISSGDVSEGPKDTKPGKSPEIDGLAAEHYVYSHKCLSVHLALLFTCILTHGYMPDAFMKTSIIPILKKKNGDTSANKMYAKRRVVFSVTRMRSSNSACMNKFDVTTEKIGSVHMTVFELLPIAMLTIGYNY